MKKLLTVLIAVFICISLSINTFAVTLPADWKKQYESDPPAWRYDGNYYDIPYEIEYCEPGDLETDWKITVGDARLALRLAIGLDDKLAEVQKKAADVNCDGNVSVDDARLILRTAIGLDFLTETGPLSSRSKAPDCIITKSDIDELEYIGIQYIKWLGVPVSRTDSTGYNGGSFAFSLTEKFREYEYDGILKGSYLTQKEYYKLDMLQSIYETYRYIITNSGNGLWSLFPIFREEKPGTYTFDVGYCMSMIPFTGTIKSAPYDFPYIYTFAGKF